jgi:hypothetical protein
MAFDAGCAADAIGALDAALAVPPVDLPPNWLARELAELESDQARIPQHIRESYKTACAAACAGQGDAGITATEQNQAVIDHAAIRRAALEEAIRAVRSAPALDEDGDIIETGRAVAAIRALVCADEASIRDRGPTGPIEVIHDPTATRRATLEVAALTIRKGAGAGQCSLIPTRPIGECILHELDRCNCSVLDDAAAAIRALAEKEPTDD